MKQFISLLLPLISAFLFLQCSDPGSFPPEIPVETLLAAPDTLNIGTQSIVLTTDLWRDFQPISPPDGKPLIAVVYIETADSSDIPSSLNPEAIYIVYNGRVWKSFFSTESRPPGELKPFRILKIARYGPKWGPDVYVDVIVRIVAGDKAYLLRAGEQYIGRSD